MQAPAFEPVIDPELPIVDPHHHLWCWSDSMLAAMQSLDSEFLHDLLPVHRRQARYLLNELLATTNTGHNIRATVFMESNIMYRISGPDAMRSVGEVEFANGIAAMTASGDFGPMMACAGIVGHAELGLGDAVGEVLEAHVLAGGTRYRGIRGAVGYDPDPRVLGMGRPHVLLDGQFREGYKWLHKLGLSFDAAVLEPQLPDLIDLARSFPETQIVLNHVGIPLGIAGYAGRREQRFDIWRDNIRILSKCENVVVKLGGLATPLPGFPSWMANPPFTSEQLAFEWRPYIETCIEAFGPNRCMFESDFPPASGACTYPVLWNAFKRLTAGASHDERAALFSRTAMRVYRLDV